MSREVARRSSMLLLALSCAAVMACGGGDDGGSADARAERGGYYALDALEPGLDRATR